jgi:hypothetical protein
MGDQDGEEQQSAADYERQINRSRERVTNFLAIVIVLATIFAGLWSFWFVGDDRMEDAKALLGFMSGLSGAIIGYYFGRAPAEAHATRANEQRQQTQDKMEDMKGAMGKVQGKIDTHAARLARGKPVAGEDAVELANNLRNVSDDLSSASS